MKTTTARITGKEACRCLFSELLCSKLKINGTRGDQHRAEVHARHLPQALQVVEGSYGYQLISVVMFVAAIIV
jgi:hypothetical protein